jgi:hypothetical protein
MALFNASASDMNKIRHDSGSLFGGYGLRDDTTDTYVFKVAAEDYTTDTKNSTDLQNHERIIKKLVLTNLDGDFRIVHIGNIPVRTRWDGLSNDLNGLPDLGNSFSTVGETWANDYKLDWTNASFSSIELQIPDVDGNWLTHVTVASSSNLGNLPARENAFNSQKVDSARGTFLLSSFDRQGNSLQTEKALAYQSLVYNTQYPFGNSTAQYLFGDDRIVGTRNDDVLRGYAGDDKIVGGYGDDVLIADFGSDQLFAGPGNDVLVFGGSSSSWNSSKVNYRDVSIELAVGGSGKDIFVFRPSQINFTGRDDVYYDMHLPNLYSGKFKYKQVSLNDVDDWKYYVTPTGDIKTLDAADKEVTVLAKAFPLDDLPIHKFQWINDGSENGNIVVYGNQVGTAQPPKFIVGTNEQFGNYQDFYIDTVGNIYGAVERTFNPPIEAGYTITQVKEIDVDDYMGGFVYLDIEIRNNSNNNHSVIKEWPVGQLSALGHSGDTDYFVRGNQIVQQNFDFLKKSTFTAAQNPHIQKGYLDVYLSSSGDIVTDSAGPDSRQLVLKSGKEWNISTRAGNNEYVQLDTQLFSEGGDVFTRVRDDTWHYNPFMTQNQNADLMYTQTVAGKVVDRGNGVSDLTQRIKIEDFQIGSDTIDLSAFGLTTEFLADPSLRNKNGTSYLKALSDLMSKSEGLIITAAKTAWTSGNTSIFIKEDNKLDSNDNGTKNDTLLEIQLVGINISSLNARFFGEWNEQLSPAFDPLAPLG